MGLLPGTEFMQAELTVRPGSRLYLFNRGVIDGQEHAGRPLTLDDFEALIACHQTGQSGAPEDILALLQGPASAGHGEEDVLLLLATFNDEPRRSR